MPKASHWSISILAKRWQCDKNRLWCESPHDKEDTSRKKAAEVVWANKFWFLFWHLATSPQAGLVSGLIRPGIEIIVNFYFLILFTFSPLLCLVLSQLSSIPMWSTLRSYCWVQLIIFLWSAQPTLLGSVTCSVTLQVSFCKETYSNETSELAIW